MCDILTKHTCRCGGIGRRHGLKIRWEEIPVPVQVRSSAPDFLYQRESTYRGFEQLSSLDSEVKNNRMLFLTSETEQSKEQIKLSVPKRRFATMRLWRARRNRVKPPKARSRRSESSNDARRLCDGGGTQ